MDVSLHVRVYGLNDKSGDDSPTVFLSFFFSLSFFVYMHIYSLIGMYTYVRVHVYLYVDVCMCVDSVNKREGGERRRRNSRDSPCLSFFLSLSCSLSCFSFLLFGLSARDGRSSFASFFRRRDFVSLHHLVHLLLPCWRQENCAFLTLTFLSLALLPLFLRSVFIPSFCFSLLASFFLFFSLSLSFSFFHVVCMCKEKVGWD